MARTTIKCSEPRGGVKTCRITKGPQKGRVFRAHMEATAGTRQKRKALARRNLREYRFTKADAKACRQRNRKQRGSCMWRRVEGRVG